MYKEVYQRRKKEEKKGRFTSLRVFSKRIMTITTKALSAEIFLRVDTGNKFARAKS